MRGYFGILESCPDSVTLQCRLYSSSDHELQARGQTDAQTCEQAAKRVVLVTSCYQAQSLVYIDSSYLTIPPVGQ
eukprot:IDg5872t1